MLQKTLLQDIYSHLSVWHYSQKFQWVLSLQACSKNSKCKCRISCFWQGLGVFLKRKERRILHTTTFVMFLMLGNHDSLHFGIIPLTPSATKTIILGSPKDSPRFGQKRKITIHYYYSPVTIHPSLFTGTIHRYCSLRNFAYLRGAVPYIWSKCFLCLVQDFFLRESFPLRAFLCENILAYTSYLLYKACNF